MVFNNVEGSDVKGGRFRLIEMLLFLSFERESCFYLRL